MIKYPSRIFFQKQQSSCPTRPKTSFYYKLIKSKSVIFSKMHSYQLQYKMKHGYANSSKPMVFTQKAQQPQEFLDCAQSYAQKHQKKQSFQNKETAISKAVNSNLRRNIDNTRGRDIDSHQNLRRSIERDRSVNLEHWRKQAFKYQERVFALEQEMSKLKHQNSNLKGEVQHLRQSKNKNKDRRNSVSSSTKQHQNMELTKLLNEQTQTITKLKGELKDKDEQLKQLEEKIKKRAEGKDRQIVGEQMSLDSIPSFSDFRKQALISHNKRNRSSQPLRDEELLDILQKLGKNIEDLDFKTEKDHSISPSLNQPTT